MAQRTSLIHHTAGIYHLGIGGGGLVISESGHGDKHINTAQDIYPVPYPMGVGLLPLAETANGAVIRKEKSIGEQQSEDVATAVECL